MEHSEQKEGVVDLVLEDLEGAVSSVSANRTAGPLGNPAIFIASCLRIVATLRGR
jgi:hypothetical protein